MTWTVTSNKTVSSDDVSFEVDAAYRNTYNKGQVRENDTATLSLSQLSGLTVERIEVYLKSNKFSGAGVFTVEANGETIASQSGTLAEWAGAYDNQDYHPVTLFSGSRTHVNNLTIRLVGTVSSLYIDRYVITYQPAPVYTVTFMTGAQCVGERTETSGGAGVLLSSMPDVNEWSFVAWTDRPFYTVYQMPATRYRAGETYYPTEDATLWAVYENNPQSAAEPVTNLQSGLYLYLDTTQMNAIAGVPNDGRMDYDIADVSDENQFYEMVFNDACDSATIQHMATGTYIGFSGTQLAAKRSLWCVYHSEDRTAFYTVVSGKQYVLFPAAYHTSNGGETYTDIVKVNTVTNTPTVLMALPQQMMPAAYTCYPETGRDIESVHSGSHELIIPVGIYQLRISDGKKTIRL